MIKLDGNKIRTAMVMGNAVMTKAVVICLAWYYGNKLDEKYQTQPWIMVTGLVLAISFGLWFILFTAKRNKLG